MKNGERITVITGIRLTPTDADLLRQLGGPRGGSKLIRLLIRAEAARRAASSGGINNG